MAIPNQRAMKSSITAFPRISCALMALPIVLSGQVFQPKEDAESGKPEGAIPPASANRFAPEDTDVDERSRSDPFADVGIMEEGRKIPADRGKEPRAAFTVRLEIWEFDTKTLAGVLDGIGDPATLVALRKPEGLFVREPSRKHRAVESCPGQRLRIGPLETAILIGLDGSTRCPGSGAD